MEATAVILAGGKSSRMKSNKALLTCKGKTFIEIIAEELDKYFAEVIVITNQSNAYDFLPMAKYGDIFMNAGPLGGIHSGLVHAAYEQVFVTACDMPFVNGEKAMQLCEKMDDAFVVIPRKGEYLQPLFAAYSKKSIPAIEEGLRKNQRKIVSFYPKVKVLYLDWEALFTPEEAEKVFFNINTPEDLKIFHETFT